MEPGELRLVRPNSTALWETAGRLIDEYVASLPVTLEFQDFAHERASLEHEYGPPDGVFLLALADHRLIGCGAFRRFSPTRCEMKRLFVQQGQRRGVGRAIAVELIALAKASGYQTMLLDTLPSMHRARRLYASLGFRQIPPYRFNPVPGTTFMALDF